MRRSDSIFRNTFFIFIAKTIDLAAAVIVSVMVARVLGVSGSGNYYFVIAYVSVFGLVVNLGIDHIIIRETARHPERLAKIIGAAIKLKTWLLMIVAPLIIGGLFIFSLNNELKYSILLLFAAQIVIRELFTIISHAVFLGLEKLEYRTITTFAFQILRTTAIAFVLIAGYGLVTLFASIIIADVVQGIWTMMIVNSKFSKPDLKVSSAEVWYFFKQALPIGMAFGFTTAFLQLDVLLLKGMRGDFENGLFANAYRVISQPIMLVVPMIWVLLPHLTRTFHQSRDALKKEGEFYLKCISTVMLPASIVIGVYATPLMMFVFGNEFEPAGIALTIVAFTLAIRSVSYLFDLTLTAAEKQIIVGIGAGIAFGSKLILELILIPKIGYIGAAWGTLGADVLAATAVYFMVRKWAVKYNLFQALGRPAIAGIITVIILIGFIDNPVIGIPLGCLIFGSFTLLFGTFNREERENIRSLMLRKINRKRD